MAAAAYNRRKIVVHISGGSLYENGGTYPLAPWNNEHHEKISASVVEFLSDNGYDAVSEIPPAYGVAAGGMMGAAISAGKLFLNLKKINDLVHRWRDQDALSKRRALFPSFLLRLEVRESDDRTTNSATDDDLNSAKVLVSLTKEISELLKKRYTACRFEYLLIAPKGKYACFSIYIPEKLITNLNLMKVIKSLSHRKAFTFCTIKLDKKWLLPSYVSFHRKSHDSSIGTLLTHHAECHLPKYELH